MTVRNTLLPCDAIKLIQAMLLIACCFLGRVTIAVANGDLTVNGVVMTDDLAIANLDCAVNFPNGHKLTIGDNGMVVCSGFANPARGGG